MAAAGWTSVPRSGGGAPPARARRHQESRGAVSRRRGTRARVDVTGRSPHERLLRPRRAHAFGGLFVVRPPVAVGRQRPVVRIVAGRGARAPRNHRASAVPERLALRRAGAAGDAGHPLGPAVVSFTSRGRIPESPGAPGLAVPPGIPIAAHRHMIKRPDPQPTGRVVPTELKPATPHQFHFWTATETTRPIGCGSGTGNDGRDVYGVVTDGFAYSDLATPLHDVVGAEGDPTRAHEAP